MATLLGFAATPLLLKYLGAERLGAYRIIEQWIGYLGFLSIGLGAALSVLILKARNRQDFAQTAALARTGIRLQVKQMLLYLPMTIALAWAMPLLVPVQESLRTELRISALIGIGIVALISPLGIFRTILECSQSGYYVNAALIVQSVFITGLSVLFGWLGYGMLGQATASVVGYIAYNALLVYFAKKWLTEMRTVTAATIERAELWRLRLPLAFAGVGNQINLMTDFIVIGYLFGPAIVTTFIITQRFINFVGGFATSISGVSWAALADLRTNADAKHFEARVLEIVQLIVGVCITFISIVASYNHHFVNLWVGSDYYGGDLLSVLIAVQLVIVGFVCFFGFMIDTQGDTRKRVYVSAIGSVFNLVLSIVLGRAMGLSGVTLATCIAFILTDAWFCPYIFCRDYGVQGTKLLATLFRTVILTMPWAITVWVVAHLRTGSLSWSALLLELSVVMTCAFLYCWLVIFKTPERELWRGRLRAMSSIFNKP
ncbi:MAG: polysaccharide biosynthesis C-terminal domain-containing protein [Pyrinomonadaceae bacterium MAG19_C2-C3]|nr:polysaccharide biosynthesis C-terminal domain-containing protein [Pyrinomonadaceae bacterium MAG19_C2-C3]